MDKRATQRYAFMEKFSEKYQVDPAFLSDNAQHRKYTSLDPWRAKERRRDDEIGDDGDDLLPQAQKGGVPPHRARLHLLPLEGTLAFFAFPFFFLSSSPLPPPSDPLDFTGSRQRLFPENDLCKV